MPVGQRAWQSRQIALGSSEQQELFMYRKELPVGDRVTEEPSSADIGDQLSEYDSDSSANERQCHPRRRRGRGCSYKLPIKDGAHAYRTTHHAVISAHSHTAKLFLFCSTPKTDAGLLWKRSGNVGSGLPPPPSRPSYTPGWGESLVELSILPKSTTQGSWQS